MSVDTTVFGRPATSGIADRIMSSASLNAIPSPAIPAEMVDSPALPHYLNMVAACYELRKIETDPNLLLEIERARSFAEQRIAAIDEQDPQLDVAPPPPPQPQLPQQPVGAAPPPQGAPAPAPIVQGAPTQ